MSTSDNQYQDLSAIPDILDRTVAAFPKRNAYSEWDTKAQNWRTLTWEEFSNEVTKWRKALEACGLVNGDRVAVLLPNSIAAAICDQAVLASGLVPVPLHAVDTPASSSFIINNSESKLLIVPKTLRWNAMVSVCQEFPTLQGVVVVDDEVIENTENSPVAVKSLKDWLAEGASKELNNARPSEDELAAIVYTSGTTGKPKGVMLTHKNIVSNVKACKQVLDVTEDDVFLSFLPFSHTFERTVTYYTALFNGAHIYFSRGVHKLAEELKSVRPTCFVSVPRVFEQFHTRVKTQIAKQNSFIRHMAEHAIDVGWRKFCRDNQLAVPASSVAWLDRLIWPTLEKQFSQPVKDMFGGRLRIAIAGGAALNNMLGRFYCALGVPLRQGYGLTETSPVMTMNLVGSNNPLTVGNPLPNVQVRISESGELQCKAPSVMNGYWKRPEATAEVFTEDGWFRTGDCAEIAENGRVRINGRLKEIIVTSTGEKIPPTDLELAIQADPLFEQIMCVGEARPFITALVVVNEDAWRKLAEEMNVDPDDPKSLQRRDVRLAVVRRIKKAAASFPQYGVPRNVSLMKEHWTVDNNLLTVTMKLRRRVIAERYADRIEELYQTPQNKV